MDLRKQFTVTNEEKRNQFHFKSKDNSSCSFTVKYEECDADENNAWIVLYKAKLKDYNKPSIFY